LLILFSNNMLLVRWLY